MGCILLNGSTPGGLPGTGRSPDELLPGVGASLRGVGVLDLETGVVDFSFFQEVNKRGNKKTKEINQSKFLSANMLVFA